MIIYYVYSAAGGDNDGSTWGNAFQTIPQALSVAVSGDQVWVKEGVYYPGAEGFVVPEGVAVYGGFSRQLSGTEGSVAGRTSTVYSTINGQWTYPGFLCGQDSPTIDGFLIAFCYAANGAGILIGWDYYYGSELLTDGDMEAAGTAAWSGSYFEKVTSVKYAGDQSLWIVGGAEVAYQSVMTATNTYRVTGYAKPAGSYTPMVYDGVSGVLLWTHSGADAWEYFDEEFTATTTNIVLYTGGGEGAAAYFDSVSLVEKISASDITGALVNNCKILQCEATSRGGGIRVRGADDSTISNCIIYGNTALYGGGIEIYDSSSTNILIDDCIIDSNEATGYGGGILDNGTDTEIKNCVIKSNIGESANVYSNNGTVLTSCVIAKGDSTNIGGVNCASNVTIVHCTIADNDDIAVNRIAGTVVIVSSILWGNDTNTNGTVTITYSNVQGGAGGTGNVNDDPLFRNDGSLHEYALNGISDSIDSAYYYASSATDIKGSARYDHPSVTNTGFGSVEYADMGAYEFQGTPLLTMPMSLYYLDQSSTGGTDGWYYMYVILRLPESPRQFGGANNVGQTSEGVKHEITSEILTDDVDSTLVEQVFIDDHMAAYRSVQNTTVDPPSRDVAYQTDFRKDGDPYTAVEMQHPKLLPFTKMPSEYSDSYCYCIVTMRWLPNYDTNSHIHIYNVDFKQFHDDDYAFDAANVCFHPGAAFFGPDIPLSAAHMKALHDSILKMIYEGVVSMSVPVFGQYAIPVV